MEKMKKLFIVVCGILFAGTAAFSQTQLTMWYHGAGNETESALINQVIMDFNESQSDYEVVLESFPQGSYNDSVTAAALAGNLPDILDIDGPILPNWAWAGYLAPLNIDESRLENFLPGAIGRWNETLYAVGLWDAACAIFARQSVLEAHEIRVPSLDSPWTGDEFLSALRKLQASGDYDYALDLGMAWTGEWYPYGFGPFLQSYGGDIIDVSTNMSNGALNGDAGMAFGGLWQTLFSEGLVPGTSQDGADRETGFLEGRYALQWNGNWAALPPLEKYGDDMLFLPAPDFGTGPKIGAASWQFGIASSSENQDGANAFIEFAIQDKYLAAFANGIGLVPATAS
ncbi:MAG: extracellular solute-binding protein, partial [Rhodobacteraceae bacterium]|nr:extracellular solute-binding protein [Paracoccaceae bacterium]